MTAGNILFSIIIFGIALSIIIQIVQFIEHYKQYKHSNYYKITQNSYRSVFNDDGRYGEYLIYQNLQIFESIECQFLFNLYIPKENGKTTEIDIIMLHQKGLFVIESKNYSGWIFGNENHKQWTQTLPSRYGECHKEHFYNPIMQNATHIRAIRKYIDDTIPIYSVIAFSDNCTLKKITTKGKTIVTYYSSIEEEIKNKLSAINNYSMTPKLFNETYNKLSQYTNVDKITKIKHICNY